MLFIIKQIEDIKIIVFLQTQNSIQIDHLHNKKMSYNNLVTKKSVKFCYFCTL